MLFSLTYFQLSLLRLFMFFIALLFPLSPSSCFFFLASLSPSFRLVPFCTGGSGPSLPHFINNETNANVNHLTGSD